MDEDEQAVEAEWELQDRLWVRRALLTRWIVTSVAVAVIAVGVALAVVRLPAEDAAVAGEGAPQGTALGPSGAAHPDSTGARRERPDMVGLVREWDEQRSRAWEEGDVRALAVLYLPGSDVAAQDVERLRRWVASGWAVSGVRPQLREVTEISRAEDRWVVEVEEELTTVRAEKGSRTVDLPSPGRQLRRITFVRHAGGWVVSGVRDASSLAQSG